MVLSNDVKPPLNNDIGCSKKYNSLLLYIYTEYVLGTPVGPDSNEPWLSKWASWERTSPKPAELVPANLKEVCCASVSVEFQIWVSWI